MLAAFAVLLPAYLLDARQLDGAAIWMKPLKFSLSLAIHFFTLAILAQQLERSRRIGLTLLLTGYAAVASGLFEQIYISIQAGRGQRSHFNIDTVWESLMYMLMGVGAVFLVLASFTLGVMIWKYGRKDGSGYRLGSIIGLIMGSVLTLLFAGYMSLSQSHSVGTALTTASSVPLLGWSRTVGDLRVPHFLVTHIMQILPLLGWALDRYHRPSRTIVVIVAIALALLSAALLTVSMAGKPVFPVL
ncbi:MAG: hypothetical protein RIA65_17640 [Woeseia sp.]